ncbi:MAG TPA: hypothetical protein VED66_05685, partial [Candidatus Sulfotelmatobacter sp.]|nr:hypothetical protein [Candidatus Sulfotelmatobacter sp.]
EVSQAEPRQVMVAERADPGWKSLYRVGGIAALIMVVFPLAEVAIGFLPGVAQLSRGTVTVFGWFTLFQNHWFLALRNLGLLNIIGAAFLAPTILAIYSAMRRDSEAYGAFGTVLFFVGLAVYLASSRAFPMLSLSSQYAVATTDAQRSLLAAAGQAMLVEGQSRAGIPLIEFACLLISAVMLKGKVFSKATACAGILGNALLIVVEIITTFVGGLPSAAFVMAICGGLSLMTWYLLVGRRLLQLGRA